MKFIIPVESIFQNLGGVILYDPHENKILKQYVHNKKWTRVGWRGGKLYNNILIATDWSDLHYFDVDKWKYIKTFTYKTFNDLHYIEIRGNKLFVVNTGLDAIEIFKNPMKPEFLERIFLFEKNPKIFDKRNIDLNQSFNTMLKQKPHSAHPNCICFNDKNIVVTCFDKKQKINTGEFIDLESGKRLTKRCFDCHDGVFYKGDFYTTHTRHESIIKFSNLYNEKPNRPSQRIKIGRRGWWRGMIINNDIAYVFASDGYKNKKTTARIARVSLNGKTRTNYKLPVVDGIYWDTIYQPNLYEE